MPFGLRNAPSTFQRAMTVALEGTEDFASAYMDDVLIFSRTREEHLQHLRTIFQSLSAHSYHLRLPKCEFIQEEVEFLGHRITKRGVETMVDKIAAVQEWSFPLTTSRQVKAFLGLVMWYRAFIPHLATIAHPLFALTSPKAEIIWTAECQKAAEHLQHLLTHAPVLARWQWELPTRVTTDASKVGLGGVLEQEHEAGWRPVAYWSRKLRDPETRYSATDLEWLAAVTAVTRV